MNSGTIATVTRPATFWSTVMFGSLGMPELLVILFIVVLIFGANRLPGLAKGMGSAVKNFKDGMKEDDKS